MSDINSDGDRLNSSVRIDACSKHTQARSIAHASYSRVKTLTGTEACRAAGIRRQGCSGQTGFGVVGQGGASQTKNTAVKAECANNKGVVVFHTNSSDAIELSRNLNVTLVRGDER